MLEQRDLLSAGAFDPTFGNAGRVTADYKDLLGPNATASAVAVQGDGKIVVAGTVAPDTWHHYFAVMRLKVDGTPDQTFGLDGRQYFTFSDLLGASLDGATAVTIDSSGRIVVAGTASADGSHGGGIDFAVARLSPNGWFDPTFGLGGRQYFTFSDLLGDNHAYANAVAIDPQGRIVLAGDAGTDPSHGGYGEVFAVGRLNHNGSFDTSFGLGGRQYFTFSDLLGGHYDYGNAVTIDPLGRIVMAGTADEDAAHGNGNVFALARLTTNGWFDTSFGLSGRQYFTFSDLTGSNYDFANAVTIDALGRIVVAGNAGPDDGVFAVGRLNDNGWFDSNFGLGGRQYFTFSDLLGGTKDHANAVAIDTQGRIVVAGTADADANHGGGTVMAVGRLNDDGSFDTNFGLSGRQYVTFSDLTGGNNDTGAAVAIDPRGNVVLAGTADAAFAVTRLVGDDQANLGNVADLTGVGFSLTSLDNGTSHTVVIQMELYNADGTATIWGTWDDQAITGTVQYDADGNIHIIFSWLGANGGLDHTFYGTVSGVAGAYHIDGMVTVLGGGGPGHCVGDETM
jgi:uncharacterized delta-60 repeat protein